MSLKLWDLCKFDREGLVLVFLIFNISGLFCDFDFCSFFLSWSVCNLFWVIGISVVWGIFLVVNDDILFFFLLKILFEGWEKLVVDEVVLVLIFFYVGI